MCPHHFTSSVSHISVTSTPVSQTPVQSVPSPCVAVCVIYLFSAYPCISSICLKVLLVLRCLCSVCQASGLHHTWKKKKKKKCSGVFHLVSSAYHLSQTLIPLYLKHISWDVPNMYFAMSVPLFCLSAILVQSLSYPCLLSESPVWNSGYLQTCKSFRMCNICAIFITCPTVWSVNQLPRRVHVWVLSVQAICPAE